MKHIALFCSSYKLEILSLVLAAPIWFAAIHYGSPYAKPAWNACANRIRPVPAAYAASQQEPRVIVPIELIPESGHVDLDADATTAKNTLAEVIVAATPTKGKSNKKQMIASNVEEDYRFDIRPYPLCHGCMKGQR